jgi:hypothetical protein
MNMKAYNHSTKYYAVLIAFGLIAYVIPVAFIVFGWTSAIRTQSGLGLAFAVTVSIVIAALGAICLFVGVNGYKYTKTLQIQPTGNYMNSTAYNMGRIWGSEEPRWKQITKKAAAAGGLIAAGSLLAYGIMKVKKKKAKQPMGRRF